MTAVLAIPFELRLAILVLIGLVIGGQINRAIYRLAWHQRLISPWSSPPPHAPGRRWFDRVPMVGWFFLRREWPFHGRAFWVRPLLLELLTAAALASLYWWEMQGGLLPETSIVWPSPLAIHLQYLTHALLFCLMLVATFIDLDEKTIPDAITLPGTLAALAIAALLPMSQLPVIGAATAFGPRSILPLRLTSPGLWPDWLDGPWGLLIGFLCFAGWWFAILHKTWTVRHGLRRAMRYLVASILRHQPILMASALLMAGLAGIAIVWLFGGEHWHSLLSALIGMAFGGGLVWAVRIIGGLALGVEAMGFGDVTLMAMIGAFLGWQPALLVFFLAPFAALVISATQWLLTRRKDIAFGPYLCLAAAVLVAGWNPFWNGWARDIFSLGWLIPAMVGVCLLLMGAILSLLHMRPSPMVSEVAAQEEPMEEEESLHTDKQHTDT